MRFLKQTCSIACLLFSPFAVGCGSGILTPPPLAVDYNLSPSSRTLRPVAVTTTHGSVDAQTALLSGLPTVLHGTGSYLVLDFGKEVGGPVSLNFGDASDAQQTLALAFSESILYIGPTSDASNGGAGPDGVQPLAVTPHGTYSQPAATLRGGFRYLTISLTSAGSVSLTGVSLQFSAAPTATDLRAYKGAFQSSDDLLNRIWYAGAYTVQLDTIDPHQGRVWPPPATGWSNAGLIGSGDTILSDGAKRDRTVWPGDLGVSALTAYASTGDTLSARNALDTLFAHQDKSGGLPYVGPEVNFGSVSDTYHLWTLDAVIDYYLYSQDLPWLIAHWSGIQSAVAFSRNKIDANGLLFVDQKADWGRQVPGGEMLSANALLYHVLLGMSYLASQVGDPSASAYATAAQSIQIAIQSHLWSDAEGMYSDVPGSSVFPQDGNALALWFKLPQTSAQSSEVSANLRARWNQYGAVTPERPGSIATFPGSLEVMAHFAAGDDTNALALMRLEWGYMLSSPNGTASTFWEGYLADGTFDYGGSYMSLAHGWATGPTPALTQYVAGLAPELSSTERFHFIPHPGGLTQASATMPLPSGAISVSWTMTPGSFTANITAPGTVAGRYGLPIGSGPASITMDQKTVWNSCAGGSITAVGEITRDEHYVYMSHVVGSHTVTVKNVCPQ